MRPINLTNVDKVNKVLALVEERASARTVTAEDIDELVTIIEKKLSQLLRKYDWSGLVFTCDYHADTFPACYNGTPYSTKVVIRAGVNGWVLLRAWRGPANGVTQRICPDNITTKSEEIVYFQSQSRNW